MSLFIRLAVSLSLALAPFAYANPQTAPQVLAASDVKRMMSAFASMGQIFRILEAYARPGEFTELKKYLAANGITEKSPLPKITVTGTKVRFAGVRGEFDFKTLANGKVGNGKNTLSLTSSRGLLDNLKATAQYMDTGNYKAASLLDLILPQAAANDPTGPGAALGFLSKLGAALVVVCAAWLVSIAAIPTLVGLLGAAAVGGLVLTLGDWLENRSGRMKAQVELVCDEDGTLGLAKQTGGESDLPVEDYLGPIERTYQQKICSSSKALGEFNGVVAKLMGGGATAAAPIENGATIRH